MLAARGRVFGSEKRETPYCRKGGGGVSRKRLSEGGGKKVTKKISRCARNDGVGNGYPLYHTKSVWEMRSSRIVIPSEAEGSFWHTGIASYVRQRKRGNLVRKEQERAECKEDFSLRPS